MSGSHSLSLSQRVQALCGQRPLLFYAPDGAAFRGNLKAFYLFVCRHGGTACLLSLDAQLVLALQQAGLPAERLDSDSARPWLAAGQWLCVPAADSVDSWQPAWLDGKTVLHLGQGSPLKRCGLLELSSPSCSEERVRWLEQHAGAFSVVLSASDWFSRIVNLAWQPQVTIKCGLPRADVLLRQPDELDLLNCGVDVPQLEALRQSGRIGFYLPTSRDQLPSPLSDAHTDWVALNGFLADGQCTLLVKPHPDQAQAGDGLRALALSHIVVLDAAADVYPLLSSADFLITDYSSVMFDFLLLDRPQILFVPDLGDYMQTDRGFVFDFPLMAPGPLCQDLYQLAMALETLWRGEDPFALERAQINAIANEYAGGACERLLDDLLELTRLQESA